MLDGSTIAGDRSAQILEALSLSRRIQNEPNVQRIMLARAQALETRALGLLPEPLKAQHHERDPAEQLERVRALLDARRFGEAEQAAEQSLAALPESERANSVACEVRFLEGKARAATRAYARAGELFESLLDQCKDPELRARAQFSAGKAAASDGQHMLAIKRFAALEQEAPKNSLADDARLYGALSYLELGVEARFTELLSALPDDYPDGDMVPEGSFRLALRRMEQTGLPRRGARARTRCSTTSSAWGVRAADFAGRERYFSRARPGGHR